MRTSFRVAGLLLAAASLLALAAAAHVATAQPGRYVCPPCGLPCDAEVHDRPGTCPRCGMALVEQASLKARTAPRKVGIPIFTGVQIIDYTGPYEIFQAAGFDVYTVAETKEPITTVAGMTVIPKYSFAEAPQPDILVVPGGGVAGVLRSAATLEWVKGATARAQHTMSVCNGAFILAKAGLLEGLAATTTNGNIPRLRAEYPRTKVVEDQRFVDTGKIITTGGLTAGIDGALHLVSRLLGKGTAQGVALGEEYDWRPDGGFVRGTLADNNIVPWIDAALDGTGTWDVSRTEGGVDRWDLEGRGTSKLSAAELMGRLETTLSTKARWTATQAPGAGSSAETTSRWRFTGRDGRPWTGTLTVRSQAKPGTYAVQVSIERVG